MDFEMGVAADKVLNDYIFKLPKLSAIDAEQVLTTLYETTYGIFDHRNKILTKARPLASVGLHEAEENTTSSSLHESIDFYIKHGIHAQTGLSMTEFLDLPREIYNKVLLAVSEKVVNENRDTDKQNKSVEKMFSGPQKP